MLSSVVEWCETPSEAVIGFATSEACWVFSDSPPLVRAVMRAIGNNVYVQLPHAMVDVLAAHRTRLMSFF